MKYYRKYTNPANPVRNFCKQKLRPLSEQLESINVRIPSIIAQCRSMPMMALIGIAQSELGCTLVVNLGLPLGGVMLVVHPVYTHTPSGWALIEEVL